MSDATLKFLIQVLTSWPIVAVAMLLLLLKPIRTLVNSINNIKVGDFQLSLQRIGESLGEPTSVKDISNLNYDDLKIFLVICGEDADYYLFKPTNISTGKFNEILQKLSDNALITRWDPKVAAHDDIVSGKVQEKDLPSFGFKTTEKGRNVHRALLDTIYEQLLHVKTIK